jgi:hypothetical protein
MPKKLEDIPQFKNLSHTELWQMAQRIGIQGASAATPREILEDALEHLVDIPMTVPTEEARRRFSSFLRDNWDRLQMQMQKEHCPDCHLSSDMEFADCWLDNRHRVS